MIMNLRENNDCVRGLCLQLGFFPSLPRQVAFLCSHCFVGVFCINGVSTTSSLTFPSSGHSKKEGVASSFINFVWVELVNSTQQHL